MSSAVIILKLFPN